ERIEQQRHELVHQLEGGELRAGAELAGELGERIVDLRRRQHGHGHKTRGGYGASGEELVERVRDVDDVDRRAGREQRRDAGEAEGQEDVVRVVAERALERAERDVRIELAGDAAGRGQDRVRPAKVDRASRYDPNGRAAVECRGAGRADFA